MASATAGTQRAPSPSKVAARGSRDLGIPGRSARDAPARRRMGSVGGLADGQACRSSSGRMPPSGGAEQRDPAGVRALLSGALCPAGLRAQRVRTQPLRNLEGDGGSPVSAALALCRAGGRRGAGARETLLSRRPSG